MSEVGRPEGLDEQAAEQLRRPGVDQIDWRSLVAGTLDDDPGGAGFERQLAEIADKAGLGPEELLGILADDAVQRSKHRDLVDAGRVRRLAAAASRNWLEIAAVAALAIAALAFAWRLLEDRTVRVVVPRQSFAAYHLLTAADVRTDRREQPPKGAAGLLGAIDQAAGRYTLRPVSPAAPLGRGDLAPAPDGLAGRRVTSLAVELGSLQPVRGMTVSLLVAPSGEGGTPAVEVEGALLLDVDREAGWIVVAVAEPALERLQGVLGAARVLLVQRPSRTAEADTPATGARP